jgi:putative membrane protein
MDAPQPPGLAAERTTLAWRRSGLSVVAVGLAIARGVPNVERVPGRPLVGLLVVALGGLAFAVSARQAAVRSRPADTERARASARELAPVMAATTLVALGAALVVLVQ